MHTRQSGKHRGKKHLEPPRLNSGRHGRVLADRRSAEAASAWSHDVLAGQGGGSDARRACRSGASHEKWIQGCIAGGSDCDAKELWGCRHRATTRRKGRCGGAGLHLHLPVDEVSGGFWWEASGRAGLNAWLFFLLRFPLPHDGESRRRCRRGRGQKGSRRGRGRGCGEGRWARAGVERGAENNRG